MRILAWSSAFPPPIDDGTATGVLHYCNELVRHNHKVHLLTPWRGEKANKFDHTLPYRITRYRNIPRLNSIRLNALLLFHVSIFRPDLIILEHAMSTRALSIVWLSKLFFIPYVVKIHGSDLSYSVSTQLDRWALEKVLRNASMILSNSQFTETKLRRLGYIWNNVNVLHPGVDTEFFRPRDKTIFHERYPLNGKKVCLSVGRIASRKGHMKVIEALPQVLKYVPNVIYLIVGRGPEEENLRRLVKERELSEYVKFLGYVEQNLLSDLYNACDLFVLPTKTTHDDIEGFGIVYSEAASCEVPVIGGRGGGVPEAVIDKETGLLVDPDNTDELATAMIRLLSDEKYAHMLGINGRLRVEKELSWMKVGDKINLILEHIAKDFQLKSRTS